MDGNPIFVLVPKTPWARRQWQCARSICRLDERVRLAPAVSVGLLQQIVEAFPRLSSGKAVRASDGHRSFC